jgi:hypothetical protein
MYRGRVLQMMLVALALAAVLSASGVTFDRASALSLYRQDDTVRELYFIFRTASIPGRDTGTDGTIHVSIRRPNGDVEKFTMGDQPWDATEAGRTEFFYALEQQSKGLHASYFSGDNICIRLDGGDAWLPEDIILIGDTAGGKVLLNANLGWNQSWWFSGERETDVDALPGRNLWGESCGF